MSIIIVYFFLLLGIVLFQTNKFPKYEEIYIFVLAFMTFKITSNYRTCSVAYAECKLRGVKRGESYTNKFLDPLVDVRYTNHIYITYPIALILFYHYFITLGYVRKLHNKIFNN